ncbi:MAG: hypothetical protein ACLQPV_02860 [Vulcanimicrobiaceae bacterium]
MKIPGPIGLAFAGTLGLLVSACGGGSQSSNLPQTRPAVTGNVAAVTIALANANPPIGTAVAIPVTVTARDASGAAIVAPATYQPAITLTDSDTSGHTTLSTTSVTAPGATITLHYDGSSAVSNVVIGATVAGVPPANIATAVFTPGAPATYGGTLTRSNVFTYPVASPLPATSASASVALSVTTGSSPNPAGPSGSDVHTIQNDAFPLQTTVQTTDNWTALLGANAVLYGFQSADNVTPTPNTLTWEYASPQIVDETAATNGAAWTNSPQASVHENDADGEVAIRTIHADGTYTENDTYPLAVSNTITVNADGSGSYLGTGWAAYQIEGFVYAAPAAGQIAIALAYYPSQGGGTSPFATIPAWFAASPKLYSQNNAVTAGATFPASCKLPATYGTAGRLVTQTVSSLDPVIGFTDAQTTKTYSVAGAGVVCMTMNDTTAYYYDYSNDQGFLNFPLSDKPQQTTTVSQTLAVTSGTPYGPLISRTAAVPSSTALAPATLSSHSLAIAQSGFKAEVERAHAQRAKAFRGFLTRYLKARAAQQGVR